MSIRPWQWHQTHLKPQIQDTLGLSYKNSAELDRIIDTLLPGTRPEFKRAELVVEGVAYEVRYRDVIACIRSLFGDPEFAKELIFAPERHYADENRTIRVYHDMHTGNWWLTTQVYIYTLYWFNKFNTDNVNFRQTSKQNILARAPQSFQLLFLPIKPKLLCSEESKHILSIWL